MIAIDSCVVIDLLEGVESAPVEALATLLAASGAVLAPVTITELLSAPTPRPEIDGILPNFYILDLSSGYWERTGALRAKLLRAGRKAALGDALIAQACIDNDVPLLTRDTDFQAFAQHCGLKLA